MWWRVKDIEFKICAAENQLLVKILSEEVCFQAGFEGRGGKAVTKNEGKRTADLCSREAEGTTTMLFSFKGGDARSSIIRRRAQRPRRDIDLDKISQVLRDSVSDYFYLILCSMGSHRMLCSTMQSY